MITGIAVEIHHGDVQETYAFLRDKLGLPFVDAGGGVLLFTLPQAILEAGQPGDGPFTLWFQCDDIDATIGELEGRDVPCAKPVKEEAWGRTSAFSLPNGNDAMLYQLRVAE